MAYCLILGKFGGFYWLLWQRADIFIFFVHLYSYFNKVLPVRPKKFLKFGFRKLKEDNPLKSELSI